MRDPKTLAEFRKYLKAELDYGWDTPTEFTRGFDACLIRYIEKIDEFIGEEIIEQPCPICEGKGCSECEIILNDEL